MIARPKMSQHERNTEIGAWRSWDLSHPFPAQAKRGVLLDELRKEQQTLQRLHAAKASGKATLADAGGGSSKAGGFWGAAMKNMTAVANKPRPGPRKKGRFNVPSTRVLRDAPGPGNGSLPSKDAPRDDRSSKKRAPSTGRRPREADAAQPFAGPRSQGPQLSVDEQLAKSEAVVKENEKLLEQHARSLVYCELARFDAEHAAFNALWARRFQGRKRVIHRRFNAGVISKQRPRRKASTL